MMSEPAASSAAVGDGLVAHGRVQSMHIPCRHGAHKQVDMRDWCRRVFATAQLPCTHRRLCLLLVIHGLWPLAGGAAPDDTVKMPLMAAGASN